MRIFRDWAPLLRIAGLLSLLVASLATPRVQLVSAAPVCADGYALWANNRTQSEVLSISGSNTTVGSAMRSNADVRLSGSNNRISGAVIYTSSFEDGGDANSYPAPRREAAAAPPVAYDIAAYRPGGAAAEAARAAGRYTVVSGDLDLAEPRTLDGLFYVTGNAKLSASQLRGAATVVAEGEIDVSGSLQQLGPYSGGLLLFSNKSAPGAAVIKLAGSDSALQGVIYGPGGMVELSGGKNRVAGLILGDTLKLSGSELQITFAAEHCPGGTQPPPPPAVPYAPGEVVVKLFNAGDLAAVAAANGLDPAPRGQFGTRPIFLLGILDGSDPQVKAGQLRPASGSGGDPRVEYAEPNYEARDPESRGRGSWVIGDEDAASYAEQWAPARIRLPEAHRQALGTGVTVAVLDTGVSRQHPALRDRLTRGYDFVDMDDDPSEVQVAGQENLGFGHGTHVAGLVALAAPGARIMPVRVLDEEGVGNIWVLAEGLLYAVERGPDGVPRNGDEPRVVNLSLGTLRPTRLLEDVVRAVTCDDDDDDDDDERCLATGGVVVVAAAGNDGNSTPQYPAAEGVAGALALGASNQADTRAPLSTYGSWVRLAAPGAQIVSTVPGGAYGVWSGTSMAAPLAAGVAALVRSADPELGPAAVAERLVSTARPIAGEIPLRLDAAAALGIPRTGETGGLDRKVFMPLARS
jgi:thermitase